MYKLCKTEQSSRRQRIIEEALLNLMGEKKFEQITITELCDGLKMPRKAFYRYFDSKDDALYALIDHTMSEYAGLSVDRSGDADRSLTRELEEYFKFWYEKRKLLLALDRSNIIAILIERTVNFPVGERIHINKFLSTEDLRIRDRIFKFAFSGLVYTMISWYREGFSTSTRDMAKIACRLLREPLFPHLNEVGIGE